MENSSKALYMAGSLLIALLIVSMLVYAFRNIGNVQNEKDKQLYEQSIIDFNKEYEAYNKKIMYGTDVISCINKAISNNEKYVKGGTHAIAGASGDEAVITITVVLNNPISESFELFEYNSAKDRTQTIFNQNFSEKTKDYLLNTDIYTIFGISNNKNILTAVNKNLSNYYDKNGNTIVKSNKVTKEVLEAKEYKLEKNYKNSILYQITLNSTDLKYVGYNPNYEDEKLEIVKDPNKNTNTWYSIEWTTALYNFKKCKFKCDDFHYNDNTGRIDNIKFVQK